MSTPSWLRPQRGPKGEVCVPLTGLWSVELHAPVTGDGAGVVVCGADSGADSVWPPSTGCCAGASTAGVLPRPFPWPAPRFGTPTPWEFEACCSSSWPASSSRRSMSCFTCGGTFWPPVALADASFSNRVPHVAGPTIPSTSRPARDWYARTAASVWGPKIPSAVTFRARWTCATSSPLEPSWSGSPPSRTWMARLAGDSAATVAWTPLDICAAATDAPGPASMAEARAADTPRRRACSRRALGSSALRVRERSRERSQSSGWARSLWACIRHVPFR